MIKNTGTVKKFLRNILLRTYGSFTSTLAGLFFHAAVSYYSRLIFQYEGRLRWKQDGFAAACAL